MFLSRYRVIFGLQHDNGIEKRSRVSQPINKRFIALIRAIVKYDPQIAFARLLVRTFH